MTPRHATLLALIATIVLTGQLPLAHRAIAYRWSDPPNRHAAIEY
jgi:hypothetical protein